MCSAVHLEQYIYTHTCLPTSILGLRWVVMALLVHLCSFAMPPFWNQKTGGTHEVLLPLVAKKYKQQHAFGFSRYCSTSVCFIASLLPQTQTQIVLLVCCHSYAQLFLHIVNYVYPPFPTTHAIYEGHKFCRGGQRTPCKTDCPYIIYILQDIACIQKTVPATSTPVKMAPASGPCRSPAGSLQAPCRLSLGSSQAHLKSPCKPPLGFYRPLCRPPAGPPAGSSAGPHLQAPLQAPSLLLVLKVRKPSGTL